MLGKLIKHDLKNISKLLLPINILIIIMTVVGVIFIESGIFQRDNTEALAIILITTYTLGLAVIVGISYFYPIVHFYRNLFSRQGYLTFTLPVCSWKILTSKVIVGYLWQLTSVTMAGISIWALAGFPTIYSEYIYLLNQQFIGEVGITFTGFMGWILVMGLISMLGYLLMIYFSISLGQLYAKHKIIGSVVVYIGLYTVLQILGTGILIPFFLSAPTVESIFRVIMYGGIIVTVILSLLFYALSGIILKKKVNLD
jgi:hypothetical protein